MDYLYGELSPPQRAELAAHLKACPACAAQLARWGGVQQRLDEWQLPEVPRPRRQFAAFKWAMAAAFMIAALGAAYGFGRAASADAYRQELRAAVQKSENDDRLLLAAMQRLDAARQAEILGLRKDLETVAVTADNTFKETEQQLIHLAALQTGQPQ